MTQHVRPWPKNKAATGYATLSCQCVTRYCLNLTQHEPKTLKAQFQHDNWRWQGPGDATQHACCCCSFGFGLVACMTKSKVRQRTVRTRLRKLVLHSHAPRNVFFVHSSFHPLSLTKVSVPAAGVAG